MSLPHALMTSLLEKSSSGYELAQRFDKSIGYFWHASHQQIYRELARMEAAGWISSSAAEDGRARKRIYQVLPAGQAELLRWVQQPTEPTVLRDEFFVKLRTEAVLGPLGLEREIEQRMAIHNLRLDAYRAIEARDFLGKPLSRGAQIQYLLLRGGMLQEETMLRWSEQVLHTLRGGQ